jgi:hypothetical protein
LSRVPSDVGLFWCIQNIMSIYMQLSLDQYSEIPHEK